jgi:hypothetical protein
VLTNLVVVPRTCTAASSGPTCSQISAAAAAAAAAAATQWVLFLQRPFEGHWHNQHHIPTKQRWRMTIKSTNKQTTDAPVRVLQHISKLQPRDQTNCWCLRHTLRQCSQKVYTRNQYDRARRLTCV